MKIPDFNELSREPPFYRRLFGRVLFGAAACAVAVGIYSCTSRLRPEQKSYGPYLFGREEVSYSENSPDGYFFFSKNTMTIKSDSVIYVCVDESGETMMNWQAEKKPELENDKLELVEITLPGGKSTFESSQINDGTLEGKLAKKAFDFLNRKYNSCRAEMREIKRREYLKETSPLEKLFSK